MANNFVRLAYAVVGEKYDTSKMSWDEVLEKFNEMNGTESNNEKQEHSDKTPQIINESNQNKQRQDKYTDGNSDNIIKSSTFYSISNDLKGYKGSGRVDLILPGGSWAQIRPQKDGSYLVRSNNGSKYVNSVEDAKQELINSFSSLKKESNSK